MSFIQSIMVKTYKFKYLNYDKYVKMSLVNSTITEWSLVYYKLLTGILNISFSVILQRKIKFKVKFVFK